MALTLDQQVVSQDCADCGVAYAVVRGSVYDDGEPVGLYLIGLHGHDANGKCARLAIAVLDRSTYREPCAAAMVIRPTADEYTFALEDWSMSPWKKEHYLGEMLDRKVVLQHGNRDLFFHIAEHVVYDLPEVQRYLNS